MDRREFFKHSFRKATRVAVQAADEHATQRASRWIRPPFALDELDFLLACTRCGECVESCPHNVIFSLPSRLGAQVFNTPALDLLNHGCHLCEDWPCVKVCEPAALKIPEPSTPSIGQQDESEGHVNEDTGAADVEQSDVRQWPKMAFASINTKSCLPYNGPECGACHVCPVPGAMSWKHEKPTINTELCTGCALCREACILETPAINIQSKVRAQDSSA